MNESPLRPDDPILTAYALGELPPAEHAAVERAVERDPALRAAVADIRALSTQLTAALAAEPEPEGVAAAAVDEYRRPPARGVGRLLAFPQVYYVVGGLAAACFAVMAILRSPPAPAARPLAAAPAGAETIRIPLQFAPPESPEAERGLALAVEPRAAGAANPVAEPLASANSAARDLAAPVPARARAKALAQAERSAAPAPSGGAELMKTTGAIQAVSTDTAADALKDRARATAGPSARRSVIAGAPAVPRLRDEFDFVSAAEAPRSGFSATVSTAGYARVRDALLRGTRPAAAEVRVEEMVNAFAYTEPRFTAGGEGVFAAALELTEAPWAPDRQLLRVMLRSRPAAGSGDPAALLARGVAIEVAFNPRAVARYRLIGFDREPSASDAADAAGAEPDSVRAGHAVTAFYEVMPVGAARGADVVAAAAGPADGEARRAAGATVATTFGVAGGVTPAPEEVATVTVRYRDPAGAEAQPQRFVLAGPAVRFEMASADFKFAAAVVEFALILRDSPHRGTGTLPDVIAWAAAGAAAGPAEARAPRTEFVNLVRRAQAILR